PDGVLLVLSTALPWRASRATHTLDTVPPALAGANAHVFEIAAPVDFSFALEAESLPVDAPHLLARQRETYLHQRLTSSGWLDDAADALTRVIHWNTIWEPLKERICTPVTRDWCRPEHGGFGDYVLFSWDTFFCAVMAQLEDPVLAVANIRAMLQDFTPDGFSPNFGCARGASVDRSQPPVGSYCVLKVYQTSALQSHNRNRALLEETFEPLLRWHRWWLPHRESNGSGLLTWGTNPLTGDDQHIWEHHNKQAAMFESGLDNSPLYDDVVFNPQTHTLELTDVGLSALYALDTWALSEIAGEVGRTQVAKDLRNELDAFVIRFNDQLWNEDAGIYQDRHWDGRFSPHLAPTHFYPLLVPGLVSDDRAVRIVNEHLLNPEEFWGAHVLPSIARCDPGYSDQVYWRGRIWAPMNFLVYEGLSRAGFWEEAHELAYRGLQTLLAEWHEEGHVHENYNGDTGDGDDVGNSDPMYTWGALLAYVALQDVAQPAVWHGWQFGNTNDRPAVLRNIRVAEGQLDVVCGGEGLQVLLDGQPLFASEQQVRLSQLDWRSDQLSFQVHTRAAQSCTLTVGFLPSDEPVRVHIALGEHTMTQPLRTNQHGAVVLSLRDGAQVSLRTGG
ncbi:MAG: hypothetical protein GYB65_07405, partial [Chloroflexi bacterium]|nr:hypothetical protein [Chloroflexota bacterium]